MEVVEKKLLPEKHVIFTFHDLGIISVYINFLKIFCPLMVGRDLAPRSSFGKNGIFVNFKLMQRRHLVSYQDDVGRVLKNGKKL